MDCGVFFLSRLSLTASTLNSLCSFRVVITFPLSFELYFMWVFGYGSLIWRPDFPYDQRVEGYIEGFCRRFHQGSTDHRGIPGAPGRVVTLERAPLGERTYGVAYHIPRYARQKVLKHLDFREKGGYERLTLEMTPLHGRQKIPALVYLANTENPEYLGPASPRAIATQIFISSGPSGPNSEYLLRLAQALRHMGVEDAHTFAIEDQLRAMLNG